MSYYLKKGNSFIVTSKEAMDLHEALPVGNYTLQKDPMSGEIFLQQIDSFVDISRHYGDNLKNAERIYNTFIDRAQSTGVMLTGEKGSGKSLLARTLSIRGYKDNVPTIVINAPWSGDVFNKFVQSIQQPTIILFDEFEKVYDREEQEEILTLLDGVYPSKKMFVITCNDKWRVDYNMRNRPGRIFYMIDFRGLDREFVREYCEDNLKNKTYIDKTCNITGLFTDFNFDMLKALVEEMNRYNEDPADALKLLNVKPEYDAERSFTMALIVDGKAVELSNDEWEGNPLSDDIDRSYKLWSSRKRNEGDYNWQSFHFDSGDIAQIDPNRGVYIYKDEDGDVLTLTKVKSKAFNYLNAL